MSTRHTIACPQCGKLLPVTSEMQGRTGKCNGCGNRLVIQIPVTTPAEADDEFELKPLEKPQPLDLAAFAAPKPAVSVARPVATASPARPLPPVGAPPKAPSPALLIAGIAGGMTLMLVSLLLVVAVAWRWMAADPAPGAGANGQAGAENNAVTNEDPATIQRKPLPGPDSWVTARGLTAVDAATWKVMAEEVSPLPKDALDLLPLQDIYNNVQHGTVFSAAGGAMFGTLHSGHKDYDKSDFRWVIRLNLYDLRKPDPQAVDLGIHEMSPGRDVQLVAAMSPRGEQVAYVHPAPAERASIYVFGVDGKQIAKITAPDITYELQIQRLWFAGETRLLVQTDQWLKAYELPSGKEAWTFAGGLPTPIQFTRGRGWFTTFQGDRFSFYSTADGTLSGEIPLPAHWQSNDPVLPSAIAFHHDGQRMATFCLSPSQDVLVTSWDIGSGKPLEQFEMPGRDFKWERINYHGAFWASDRRIVASTGQVIDFDHHTWICKVEPQYGAQPAESFDGRWWVVGYPGDENNARLQAKFGKPYLSYLFAGTVPSPAKEKEFAQTKQKLLIYPGCTLGVTADDSIPGEHKARLLIALADALATRGMTVDPNAKIKVQLHSGEVNIVPNVARIIGMPDAPKSRVWMGVVYGRLIDENGKPLDYFYEGITEYVGEKEDTWKAMPREFAKKVTVPRYMRWGESPATSGTVQQPLPVDKVPVDGLAREGEGEGE